jgi:ABC-type uncharacterized transport system permease subunit
VFQITIFFLYLVAALAFGLSRFPQQAERAKYLVPFAFLTCTIGLLLHGQLLSVLVGGDISLSLAMAVSIIGLQLALIGLLGAFDASLRGVSAGLLLLAAITSLVNGEVVSYIDSYDAAAQGQLSWQLRSHVMTSMFAYGLLTVGAIIAIYALVQDSRLRSARLSPMNNLFAPLETTERMLNAVSATGFIVLALSVVSGITFIEDLFAQHLVHKTALSLLALLLFGILLLGRQFAGWRGKRAVYLYLASFLILSLAYFGVRYILEELLERTWS